MIIRYSGIDAKKIHPAGNVSAKKNSGNRVWVIIRYSGQVNIEEMYLPKNEDTLYTRM